MQTPHSLRRDEGMFFDGVKHIAELDLGGEGVAVVDNRHPIRTVPAVHCKTAHKHTSPPAARHTTTHLEDTDTAVSHSSSSKKLIVNK